MTLESVQPFLFYNFLIKLYMSRFNEPKPKTPTKTVNLAGGTAYKQSHEAELVSSLVTSFANDQFYQKAPQAFERLKQLLASIHPKFAAQAIVYARKQFGMRSVSHIASVELAKYISGELWAKNFYEQVVHRPDDMVEITAYVQSQGFKLTGAMKRGFAKAFDKFDAYQLGKYRCEDKKVKLVDVVNTVHPEPIERNSEALKALVNNTLKSEGTWESELSKAGQSGEGDFKKDVWVKLINDRKLGYTALLRNLRNISTQAPEALDAALLQLTNEAFIKKSLIMPVQYLKAFDALQGLPAQQYNKMAVAINQAMETSLSNVPKFTGETLLVLDVSGSMTSGIPGKRPCDIAAPFAATLLKANRCDFMMFSTAAQYVNINTMDSLTTIINNLRFGGGGTNFPSIFETANKKYDRVIILSDMQGWVERQNNPVAAFNQYRNRIQANPFVYSFDLAGLGTLQLPEDKVFCLAGFSDKIFDIMQLLETDKNALVNTIKENIKL
jgi:60 kDa SS-A/Ro ribonucleoprotein